VLVLVPKCPVCLAVYAAWLGLGLSVPAASVIREVLVITCIATLVVVALRWTASFARRRSF
jgi:hypothetical protein